MYMNGAGIGMAIIAKIPLIILMVVSQGKREFAGMLDISAQLNKLEQPIGEQGNQISIS